MGEKVQLKGDIYEANFGYNVKKEVYANSSSDIPNLYDITINIYLRDWNNNGKN
jgi:hypothetical protein